MEENAQSDDASVVVIPGSGPEMEPPRGVNAEATNSPNLPRRQAIGIVESVKRRAASPELPNPTRAPMAG